MKSFFTVVVFVGAACGVGAGRRGDPEAGAIVYQEACASCHGTEGLGVDGKDPAATGANLRMRVEELSDSAIERAVVEGTGDMEPLSMTQTEVDDVIAFIRQSPWDE